MIAISIRNCLKRRSTRWCHSPSRIPNLVHESSQILIHRYCLIIDICLFTILSMSYALTNVMLVRPSVSQGRVDGQRWPSMILSSRVVCCHHLVINSYFLFFFFSEKKPSWSNIKSVCHPGRKMVKRKAKPYTSVPYFFPQYPY